jgi:raffinose synthase
LTQLASFVDWFGWDGFYRYVTADDAKQGLRTLAEGGVPPRFVIMDYGWQQIESDNKPDPSVVVQEGAQFESRLTGIKENSKFQSKKQHETKKTRIHDEAPGTLPGGAR